MNVSSSTKSPKGQATLDRQYSSASTITRTSSWADLNTSFSTLTPATESIVSSSAVLNLVLSFAVFGLAFYCTTEYFIPTHEKAYDRPHPYQITAKGDLVLDFQLNQPLVHPASVPSKLLHQTCVFAPLVLLLLIHSRSSWNCFLASISGHLTGIGLCELITHILKYYVLRRRPNFYALCGWAGDSCTSPAPKVLEAQLSFPSGHSSLSWCSMTFLVWVLLGKIHFCGVSQGREVARRQWLVWAACLGPWSWSTYVATIIAVLWIIGITHRMSLLGHCLELSVLRFPIIQCFRMSCRPTLEFPMPNLLSSATDKFCEVTDELRYISVASREADFNAAIARWTFRSDGAGKLPSPDNLCLTDVNWIISKPSNKSVHTVGYS